MKYSLNLNIAPYSNLIIDLDEVNLPEIQDKITTAIKISKEKDRLWLIDSINQLIVDREFDIDAFYGYYKIESTLEMNGFQIEKLKEIEYYLKEKPLKGANDAN